MVNGGKQPDIALLKCLIMKKLVIVLVLTIICNIGYAQMDSLSCSKFRKGQFVYLNDSMQTIVVKRTEKKTGGTKPTDR